jgi:hypothetical protein
VFTNSLEKPTGNRHLSSYVKREQSMNSNLWRKLNYWFLAGFFSNHL